MLWYFNSFLPMETVVGQHPLSDLWHLLQHCRVKCVHPAVRDPVPTGSLQALQVLLSATRLQLFKMNRGQKKDAFSSICSVGMMCTNANIKIFYEKRNKTLLPYSLPLS